MFLPDLWISRCILQLLIAHFNSDELEFKCEGIDEKEALAALVEAIENGLGE